jgi:uncharacterized membrane protein
MNNLFKIVVTFSFILAGCSTQGTTGTNPTPAPSASAVVGEKVEWLKVKALISQKCQYCHSLTPKDSSHGVPASGVSFDTDAQIKAKADRINARAVVDKTMPFNNVTKITQEERDLLGKWFAAGAPIQ